MGTKPRSVSEATAAGDQYGLKLFEIECCDDVVVAVALANLSEFEYAKIENDLRRGLELLETTDARHVVVDFHNTDYFGSTALGVFIKLSKQVKEIGGRMAFCCLSQHEKEILQLTQLDSLWVIAESREQAIELVHKRVNSAA